MIPARGRLRSSTGGGWETCMAAEQMNIAMMFLK
jgi:hypothetical protein